MAVYRPHKNKKRCPFCNTDVSTPYKGIHYETELVNGIPTQCRNNGKLNAHIAYGYTLQKEQPRENVKFFVEDPETNLWFDGYNWTNDPNRAVGMEFGWVADRYARMKRIENYVITEHIFI